MKYKNFLPLILIILYTLFLLIFPTWSISAATDALRVCFSSLIPSLFPFFVCSNLLIGLGGASLTAKLFSRVMKPLFNLDGSLALAMVMGIISGYPVGAKTVADIYTSGTSSKHDCEKALSFCNNCGPMFILGALGSNFLGQPEIGRLLYFSHILSSLSVAFIMRFAPSSYKFSKQHYPPEKPNEFSEIFTSAISSSITSILTVCGFVIFFSILVSFIEKMNLFSALSSLGIDYKLLRSIIYGFFECSGGSICASALSIKPIIKYMLLSSILAWSGLSVHLQVLGIIKKAKLSPKFYFKGKILMTIISPVITYLLYNFGIKITIPIIIVLVLTPLYKRTYLKHAAFPPR